MGHLGETIRVADLAALVNLSVARFALCFQASTGVSPHRFLLNQRVEAAMLLRGSPLPMAEVAVVCGFSSQQHMATVMRRLAGVAPIVGSRPITFQGGRQRKKPRPRMGPERDQSERGQTMGFLTRKQHKRVAALVSFGREPQAERDAAGIQNAIAQKQAKVGIAVAGRAACVEEPGITGEPGYHYDQVGVDDGSPAVGYPMGVAIVVVLVSIVEGRHRSLRGHIQEFEAFVTPRQRIVVVDRQATRHQPVLRPQRGEIGAVLRVCEIAYVWLHGIRRGVRIVMRQRRVIQRVLQEVGEIVDLLLRKAETPWITLPARIGEAGG